MKIQTQLTNKTYLILLMTQFFRNPVFIFFGIVGIILFFCFYLDWNIEGLPETPYYYLIFSSFFLIINPLFFYWTIKRQISNNPELTKETSYEFTSENIKIYGGNSVTEIPWEKISKITINQNWVIIYQFNKVMNFIPVSNFNNHFDKFKKLTKDKGF